MSRAVLRDFDFLLCSLNIVPDFYPFCCEFVIKLPIIKCYVRFDPLDFRHMSVRNSVSRRGKKKNIKSGALDIEGGQQVGKEDGTIYGVKGAVRARRMSILRLPVLEKSRRSMV